MFVLISLVFFKNLYQDMFLDFTSNDVNKQIHAYFNCPKKLRPKHKRMEREIPKHFLMFNDDQQDHLPIFDGIKIK